MPANETATLKQRIESKMNMTRLIYRINLLLLLLFIINLK